MIDLISLEKYFLSLHIFKGCTAVDFTMGNGNDTLFLSMSAGEDGRVYGFDIQIKALENTKLLLESNNAPDNYTLVLASHEKANEFISGGIDAGIFNLGYLPGGDKNITTLRDTTLQAVSNAVDMLNPGGGLLVAVYPGHPEGRIEGNMLEDFFEKYNRGTICASKFEIINSPGSPFFFLIEKARKI